MDKLISVVVPIYNVENYLKRCIDSIVNQTYENLEIILVDDGSTDGSSAICDAYAKKENRIKVVHQKNAGLSAARNNGFKMAKGEYIGFIDADDYVEPAMYEELLHQMLLHGADMAIGNVCRVDENGYLLEDTSAVTDAVYTKEEMLRKITEENGVYFVTAWNKLYKREIFDKVSFPEGKIHEDEFVIHEILDCCKKIVTTKKIYYYYVQRANSIMSEEVTLKRFDGMEALYQRFLYYKQHEELNDCLLPICNQCMEIYVGLMSRMKAKERKKCRKQLAERKQIYRSMYQDIGGVSQLSLKKKIKYYVPKTGAMLVSCKEKLRTVKPKLKCFLTVCKILRHRNTYDYVLSDTPEHGNLGDHAIALAESRLLEKMGKRYLELTANEIDGFEEKIAKFIPKEKSIFITGGGFFGDLWLNEEYRVHRLLQAFSENKIIAFPQTIFYDLDSIGGRKLLELSQSVYAKHPDFTIFAREKKSFAFLKEYFPSVHAYFVPDIVLTYQPEFYKKKREGILMCMRSDKEKSIKRADVIGIENHLYKKFGNLLSDSLQQTSKEKEIRYTDTVVPYTIKPKKRSAEVNKKLEEFASAKLVITDRLHGMIFAAITGTPCIAFGNSSGKVKGVYEWIKDLEYIKYVEHIEDFEDILEHMHIDKTYVYDAEKTDEDFDSLYTLL